MSYFEGIMLVIDPFNVDNFDNEPIEMSTN